MVTTLRRKLRRDVLGHRLQFLAVALPAMIGIALFVGTFDAHRNLQDSYDDTFRRQHFADLTVTGGAVEAFAGRAVRVPGVAAVGTRIVADVAIRVGDHELWGRIVGLPDDGEPAVGRVEVLRGSYLVAGRSGQVLVEQHMAEHFHLDPGDSIALQSPSGSRAVSVRGVVSSAEYLWPARSRQDNMPLPDNFGVVFVPDSLARIVTGTDRPSEALVSFDEPPDPALVARLARLAGRMEAGTLGVTEADDQVSNAVLQSDLDAIGELAVLFPLLFLLATGLGIYVLLARRVHSEAPIIGTLRSVGFERRHIVTHYLAYGVTAAGIGSILGLAGGIWLARLTTNSYANAIDLHTVTVEIRPGTLAIGLAFGLVAGAVAAFVPAHAASRVSPAQALRASGPSGGGRRSALERVFPPLGRLPLRFTAVLRGLERNRRRSASTALGVAMALALVLVAWIMLDSTNEWLADAREVNRYDARMMFDKPVDGMRLDDLTAEQGVTAAETARFAPVSIRAGSRRYDSTAIGLEPSTTMHHFDAAAGAADRVPRRGVVVGSALRTASSLDLDVGDIVDLTFAGGRSTRQPVVGFVDEPIGTYVYASESNLAAWDPHARSSALVRFEPDANRGAVLRRLTGLPGVIAVEDNDSVIDAMREYMQLIYVLIGMMLVFGAAMAFGLLFTTMSVNVAERSVELATLRASGVEHRRLSRLVTGENVLLTALGIAPGMLLGIWLAGSFLSVYTNDLWHFDLVVRPSSLTLAGAAVIVTALVAQRPALRAVRRLAVAEVVRTRSS